MSELQRSMFNREVDFSLEETINSYEACLALSLRARESTAARGTCRKAPTSKIPTPPWGHSAIIP